MSVDKQWITAPMNGWVYYRGGPQDGHVLRGEYDHHDGYGWPTVTVAAGTCISPRPPVPG
jgi:hypothetical protein